MEFLTIPELKARVPNGLTDEALGGLISETSALILFRLGNVEPGSPVVERFTEPGKLVQLTYKPENVSEVRNLDIDGDDGIIDADTYRTDGRAIFKRTMNRDWYADNFVVDGPRGVWPKSLQVTYAMADSPQVLSIARGVCIDLCRLAIFDMGPIQQEGLSKHSQTSKDVEKEKRKVMSRLHKVTGIRPVMTR